MKNFRFLRFWLLLAVGMATVVFNSYGQKEKNAKNNSATTDPGVVINGVKWATRNVDAFGSFTATPESPCMFYQWNNKTAWSATEPSAGIAIDNWDSSFPASITWEKTNDPSPKGWRIPTEKEQRSLFDTEKVSNEWTTQNDVTGRKFTDKATGNTLFLPAAGFRLSYDGSLLYVGTGGYYWGSSEIGSDDDYVVRFDSDYAGMNYCRPSGFSVRCVAE